MIKGFLLALALCLLATTAHAGVLVALNDQTFFRPALLTYQPGDRVIEVSLPGVTECSGGLPANPDPNDSLTLRLNGNDYRVDDTVTYRFVDSQPVLAIVAPGGLSCVGDTLFFDTFGSSGPSI